MLDDTFDPMAVVVDWLDSCRVQNLDGLFDLYEYGCGGPHADQRRRNTIARKPRAH